MSYTIRLRPSKSDLGKWTLSELAEQVGGRVQGNANKSVTHVDELRHAQEDAISHCSTIAQKRYLQSTSAGIVILPEGNNWGYEGDCLLARNSRIAFAQIVDLMHPEPANSAAYIAQSAFVHPTAKIADSARIEANVVVGENVDIGDNAVIGAGTVIGDDVIIGPGTTVDFNVSIYGHCVIGRNCRIYSCVVLGASGFSYEWDGRQWNYIRNIGGVTIGDDVDIGASTSIDRGSVRSTIIGNGVKIDNNVQIGHNVEIGDHSLIVGNVGIAGSAKIGKRCVLGGQVSIVSHVEIADDVTVQACSLITKSIATSGSYSSSIPAKEASEWKRSLASLSRMIKEASSGSTDKPKK
ncbi:MAG: UDP-3-O-(3-hydroxymyristoyl)glucosamine N-acyltransferase [Acidiferrobacterales bacterium]|nr:UDP-3-O-(3-hydroxymyristoyl)glucosamine N-acyltransferase [Acidiferrobacterales bacterium]